MEKYLILREEEIYSLKSIANDELQGDFETSSDLLNATELVEWAVSYYMCEDGQLIRGCKTLLEAVLRGVTEQYEQMEETKDLDFETACELIKEVLTFNNK